eukprot:767277-Hanusia_phi.AAC.7
MAARLEEEELADIRCGAVGQELALEEEEREEQSVTRQAGKGWCRRPQPGSPGGRWQEILRQSGAGRLGLWESEGPTGTAGTSRAAWEDRAGSLSSRYRTAHSLRATSRRKAGRSLKEGGREGRIEGGKGEKERGGEADVLLAVRL